MTDAKEYTVKRIDKNTFELWHEEQRLATLTKEEAWPVMIGQVHPDAIIRERSRKTAQDQRNWDE